MAGTGISIGKVVLIQGHVVAQDAQGVQRVLKLGDELLEGEIIITSPGGRVEIGLPDGHVYLREKKR